MLLVMLTKLHWLLRDWLSLKVQGPIFSGRASKETLICGGVAVAMAGAVVDIVVVPVVPVVSGGVKVFFVGGAVEASFFFVDAGLV